MIINPRRSLSAMTVTGKHGTQVGKALITYANIEHGGTACITAETLHPIR